MAGFDSVEYLERLIFISSGCRRVDERSCASIRVIRDCAAENFHGWVNGMGKGEWRAP